MVIKPLQIKLDIAKKNDRVYLVSKQNDTARAVEIQLLNNGEKIILPQSANVTLNVKKPDGTFAKLSCTVNPDGTATGEFTNQALAAVGDAEFDVIALYTENGEQKQISALNGRLYVQAAAIPEDVVVSTNEFKALTDALLEIQDYKTSTPKGITYDTLNDRLTAGEADTLQLRVQAAQLESELAAIRAAQAQMSTDTRIDLPGTGKVTAVPKNAAVLGVGGTIKGMTLRNLVTNGDFSNGTTGWSAGSAVLSAADNTLTITGRGTSQYCSATQSNICPNITNKKVFIKGRFMVTNPDCLSVHVRLEGSVAERVSKIIIENPMANTWYSFTALLQLTSAIQGESISLVIYHRYANAASSLDKAMQIKDIVAIDLDEHGLQFKSETELAQICPNYISGTQSVLAARIRSTDADGNTASACYIEPTLLRRNVEGVYDEIDLFTGRLTINLDESGEEIESPIIKDNVITGTLLSSPGGSIICEPVIADAGMYDDGVIILREDFPIESLESLCKVNADGTLTPLDVSTAVIASGGLSFTHPAFSKGDIVAFTYFTVSSGVIGENVYNYVNANGLTLGADGKYYRVGFAIDINGNISLTKTEVV